MSQHLGCCKHRVPWEQECVECRIDFAVAAESALQVSNAETHQLTMPGLHWHKRFIQIAQQVAGWSKDHSTKVGAVIVRDRRIQTTGFNGFPVGVNDDIEDRHERPRKYLFTVHAEHNAVLQAARDGISLMDCTLYLNTNPVPCCQCTLAVIQAGIAQVVGPDQEFEGKGEHWKEQEQDALTMLQEAGVNILRIPVEKS